MYRISNSADWNFLVGKELLQVCVGLYQVSLRFDGDASLNIECDFEHLPAAMNTPGSDLPTRAATLVSLLGTKVIAVVGEDAKTLVVTFSNRETLKIHDSNDSYESFQLIAPEKQIIV